jgi:hypothetical protein
LPPCNVSSSSITNTPPPPYNSIDRHEVLESNTSGYSVHGAASVQDLSAMRQASEAWEGQGVVVGRRVRTRRRRNLFTIPPYYPRSPRRIAGVSSVPAGLGQPPPYSSRGKILDNMCEIACRLEAHYAHNQQLQNSGRLES